MNKAHQFGALIAASLSLRSAESLAMDIHDPNEAYEVEPADYPNGYASDPRPSAQASHEVCQNRGIHRSYATTFEMGQWVTIWHGS
jgi:hypothetical protein